MKIPRRAKHILAVGGGKGGVGKSIFAIALATDLARRGQRVVLADFDLGSANLHTYLGVDTKKSLADFFHRKVNSLEEILEDTGVHNLKLISGSEFVPGIANPAYWIKLKMIRHIKAIDADFIIIDLGAGVHFNVLDLFGMADTGIVVTTPEPGAVINAYSFIKGALFRKIEVIFRHHPQISPIIKNLMEKNDAEGSFSINWLGKKIEEIDMEMSPMIKEIADWFKPSLVVNMMPNGGKHILTDNLKLLCKDKLGIHLVHTGNVPVVTEIPQYLLNIPNLFNAPVGKTFKKSLSHVVEEIIKDFNNGRSMPTRPYPKSDFDDESIKYIMSLIDNADDLLFKGTSKKLWKLRLFFKPGEVINFLISKGIEDDAFFT